jgi:GNAT superfamily N-acetyltransferase
MALSIQPITTLTFDMLRPLLDKSREEGYDFIQKLWDEYQSGAVPFRDDGAALLGIFEDDQLIGIGGVHTDPYEQSAAIGRIRHVYVLPEVRRQRVGQQLMTALIDHASHHFITLTLRTPTAHGRAFYTSLGFSETPRFKHATHWLDITPQAG